MSSARRGIATEEMKQVAKDEDVSLDYLVRSVASGSRSLFLGITPENKR
jgi:phosphomethylpyrimidine synthase